MPLNESFKILRLSIATTDVGSSIIFSNTRPNYEKTLKNIIKKYEKEEYFNIINNMNDYHRQLIENPTNLDSIWLMQILSDFPDFND